MRAVILSGEVKHAGGGGGDLGLCAIGPKPECFCQQTSYSAFLYSHIRRHVDPVGDLHQFIGGWGGP